MAFVLECVHVERADLRDQQPIARDVRVGAAIRLFEKRRIDSPLDIHSVAGCMYMLGSKGDAAEPAFLERCGHAPERLADAHAAANDDSGLLQATSYQLPANLSLL